MESVYHLPARQPEFSATAYQAQRNGQHPNVILYRHGHNRTDMWGHVYDAAIRINRTNPNQRVSMVLPNIEPHRLRMPVLGCACVLYQSYRDNDYVRQLCRALFRQGAEMLTVKTFEKNPDIQMIFPDDLGDIA